MKHFCPKFQPFDHDLQQTIKTGRLPEHDPNSHFYAEKGGGTTITQEVPPKTEAEERYEKIRAEYAERIMPLEAEYYETMMPLQKEMLPIQKELAEMQMEAQRMALRGEVTPEREAKLGELRDLYKTQTRFGIEEAAEEMLKEAGQAGLARGVPYSDIARGFERDVGKWATKEIGRSEREAESLYQQAVLGLPPMIAGGGGPGTTPTFGKGTTTQGVNLLSQMIGELKGERYGMPTQTQTMAGKTAGQYVAGGAIGAGVGAAGGAAVGAKIGAIGGPWGAAIGAGLGLLGGLFY